MNSVEPSWDKLQSLYQKQGVEAWRSLGLPEYLTSNPFVAQTYAELLVALFKDSGSHEPLTLLELGAGSGHFAYLVLLYFQENYPSIKLRYIFTDLSAANCIFCKEHFLLKPFEQMGMLECLPLDATDEGALKAFLDSIHAPLYVVGNYFLDVLPCTVKENDLFIPESAFKLLQTLLVRKTDTYILFADRAYTEQSMGNRVKEHGPFFSVSVDFHWLKEKCLKVGVTVLLDAVCSPEQVYSFFSNRPLNALPTFQRQWKETIDTYSPLKFFREQTLVEEELSRMEDKPFLSAFLKYLAKCQYDPAIYLIQHEKIVDLSRQFSLEERHQVVDALGRVSKKYYPLLEDAKVYCTLGSFMNALGAFKESEPVLDNALRIDPEDLSALSNRALSAIAQNRPDEAVLFLKRVEKQDKALAKQQAEFLFIEFPKILHLI